jgi:hypothetical protein
LIETNRKKGNSSTKTYYKTKKGHSSASYGIGFTSFFLSAEELQERD